MLRGSIEKNRACDFFFATSKFSFCLALAVITSEKSKKSCIKRVAIAAVSKSVNKKISLCEAAPITLHFLGSATKLVNGI